jgi:hypothetical protein
LQGKDQAADRGQIVIGGGGGDAALGRTRRTATAICGLASSATGSVATGLASSILPLTVFRCSARSLSASESFFSF